MERITHHECASFHGLLALQAIGKLPGDDAVALRAHLDGCADRRAEARHLHEAAAALAHADPDHLGDEVETPLGLADAVFGALKLERRHEQHRRRAGSAGAAPSAPWPPRWPRAWSPSPCSSPGRRGPRARLRRGAPGVHATAQLTAEPFGTSITLVTSGQRAGQTLWVAMRTRNGQWWEAGTYRTAAGSVRVTMSVCALHPADITGVRIVDGADHEVLGSYQT